MTNTALNTETALTLNNEIQPWGNPEEFDMPEETVIDTEYTEIVPSLENTAKNDNNPDNQPTPPATSTALIPYGNTTQAIAIPVSPEDLKACIEINQGIATTAMNLAQKPIS